MKRKFGGVTTREFDGAGPNGMNWKSGMEYGDNSTSYSNNRKGPKRVNHSGSGKGGNVDGVVDYVLYE